MELAPPLLHSYLVEGVQVALTHPVYYFECFNMASMQDTAHIHTKQMGGFKTPLHFGRAPPPHPQPTWYGGQ